VDLQKEGRKFSFLISNPMEELITHQCKNCSSESEGNFCTFCGQRYHAHKESFGELVYEFLSDFMHFDSRFFRTVLPLLFNPGVLTKRYNEGKQISQFHPIRLYLFSSFVYFFLFFYFNDVEDNIDLENNKSPVAFTIDSTKPVIRQVNVTIPVKDSYSPNDTNNSLTKKSEATPLSGIKERIALEDTATHYSFTTTTYVDSLLKKKVTPEDYIKQQSKLTGKNKAGFFKRMITIKLLKINLKGEDSKKEFFRKVIGTFFHNIPKMLFFLLPVFALLLKLLYLRRKQFYYVDHAVLSLHYFSLIFLLLILCNFVLDKLFGTDFFTIIASLWIQVYLVIAMKKLYRQSWTKTFVKFFALGFLFFIAVVITLIGNMAWSTLMI
jgi:hypothetical protein